MVHQSEFLKTGRLSKLLLRMIYLYVALIQNMKETVIRKKLTGLHFGSAKCRLALQIVVCFHRLSFPV